MSRVIIEELAEGMWCVSQQEPADSTTPEWLVHKDGWVDCVTQFARTKEQAEQIRQQLLDAERRYTAWKSMA